MTDLTKLSPAEVDTIYLERLAARERASREVFYARLAVLREAGVGITVTVEKRGRKGYETVYVSQEFAKTLPPWHRGCKLEDVREHILGVEYCVENGLAPEAAVRLEEVNAACRAANAACREVQDEYSRRPWSRYWLVTSSDGHIHESTCCSTCNKGKEPTGFALTPFLSGKTSEEAVADLGPALCSVCFPNAPVESKEQARVSGRLALVLAEKGVQAFQEARQETEAKRASRCPGSGQQGVPSSHRAFHKCPVCGESQRATPGGKFRPHKPAQFYIENADWKCWSGSAWGPRTKAAIYGSLDEAGAVAAQVGGKARRK